MKPCRTITVHKEKEVKAMANSTFGSIFEIKTVAGLRILKPSHFAGREVTQDEFTHILRVLKAFWQYEGEPRPWQPHARTRDDKCTDGFINLMEVLRESNLCEILASQLLAKVRKVYSGPIHWVVSAAYAGIDLGHEVGRQAGAIHAFTEKDQDGNPTVWARHTVGEGEVVLITNELMTTAHGSPYQTKAAVRDKNKIQPVQFAPVAAVLVNRSADAETLEDGTPLAVFARYYMHTYQPGPATCKYCAAGSPSIKPKVEGNWEKHFQNV